MIGIVAIAQRSEHAESSGPDTALRPPMASPDPTRTSGDSRPAMAATGTTNVATPSAASSTPRAAADLHRRCSRRVHHGAPTVGSTGRPRNQADRPGGAGLVQDQQRQRDKRPRGTRSD